MRAQKYISRPLADRYLPLMSWLGSSHQLVLKRVQGVRSESLNNRPAFVNVWVTSATNGTYIWLWTQTKTYTWRVLNPYLFILGPPLQTILRLNKLGHQKRPVRETAALLPKKTVEKMCKLLRWDPTNCHFCSHSSSSPAGTCTTEASKTVVTFSNTNS